MGLEISRKTSSVLLFEKKLNIGIIRTANIYGPFDRFDDYKSHVIPEIIKRAAKKKNLSQCGVENTVRDFVFADDLSVAVAEEL